MKTITIHAAHDLRVEQRDDEAPGPGQVEIAIGAGGICGSDLHYFHNGGFGTVRVKEPMILGHEVAGRVTVLGSGVTTVKVGDTVAVNPSRPCGLCNYCQHGLQNHCIDMRFYGSAMRFPHVQGAFRDRLVADASQCVPVAAGISVNAAAFGEPFAVALHAVGRAGALNGRRVLVTGCGPIGALVVMAARHYGALEIVATDVLDEPLAKAQQVGADVTINVAAHPERMDVYAAGKGVFDVMIEASGNAKALIQGLAVLRPRGILVQLGLGGEVTLPINTVVAKEIDLRGSFRFHDEFAVAIDLINRRRVDMQPLLTQVFPADDAVKAFEMASDRRRAMKVQIGF